MFKSLKSKFIIFFVLLQLFFFVIIVSINFNFIDKASETLTYEKLTTTNQLLVELLKTPLIVSDLATMDDIVHNFSSIDNVVGIEIRDSNNINMSRDIKREMIPEKLFEKAIVNGDDRIRYEDKEYVFSSVDVIVEDKVVGHVHFGFDTTQGFESIQNNKDLTYLMVSIALIIGLTIAYALGGSLGKSLKLLTDISKDIAQGKKVDIPKKENLSDEMMTLFQSVTLMQDIIFERTQKLNKSIELFGANVIASSSDKEGKITYASQALCDISGYTHEEWIGEQPHSILRHQDMPDEVFTEIWHIINSGKAWKGELINHKKEGGYYWVDTSVVPEFDKENNLIGYTAIQHDITAQKVKEEFMANMSHELRTPLNAIIGFSTILNKRLTDPEQLGLLGHISSSAGALLFLINSLLDLSKIQDAKFTIQPHAFNAFNEILASCEYAKGLMAQKNIRLGTDIDENLKRTLLGDWYRINQIILNLISNAIKFTDNNGEIKYASNYQDNNLVLTVSDNGIGMSQEVQDRVFEPFEQADGSTTRKYGGTGLGLSITQSLVEHMHGRIELESQEGLGTSVTVIIPLEESSKPVKNSSVLIEDDIQLLSGHILVAEDNATNQILITMLLEEFGLTCDVANDGIEAVEMYSPDTHRLILMDENMPRMNGIEAMKTLHKKHKKMCGPIIALTANAMSGDKDRFLEIGMDGYIPKPIDKDELYRVLKQFL